MNENKEKVCMCGRIITDPNNKTGLCPKCQKVANNIFGIGVVAALGVGINKYASIIVKNTIKIMKK